MAGKIAPEGEAAVNGDVESEQPADGGAAEGTALAAFSLIAGSAFLFTSYAKDTFPPLTLTMLRLAVGSTGLLLANLAYDRLQGVRAASLREVASLSVVGLANTAVPYTLFAAALSEGVGVGVASAMTGAAPLFAAAAAAVFIAGAAKRLQHPRRALGLFVGFSGVVLIALHKEAVKKHKGNSTSGVLLQLAGVSSKAVAAVLAQQHNTRFPCRRPPLAQAFVQASAGCALATVLSLAVDCAGVTPHTLDPHGLASGRCYSFFGSADRKALGSLLYLGLCSSCAVYVLQFFLLRRVGAVRQLVVDYCTPIVGVVEGALFKSEWDHVSAPEVVLFCAGALLAASGVAMLHWPDRPAGGGDQVASPEGARGCSERSEASSDDPLLGNVSAGAKRGWAYA